MSHSGADPVPIDTDGAIFRSANIIAPALILLLPFVIFLSFHEYGLWRPEALLCIAVIATFGIIFGGLAELYPALLRPAVIVLFLILFLDLQIPGLLQRNILWLLEVFGEPRLLYRFAALVLRVAVIFLALGLIFAVFRCLRHHVGLIISVIFGVASIATVLLPMKSLGIGASVYNSGTTPDAALPPVVHFILDGHIGIEGLPSDIPGGEDLRRDLKKFYQSNGFALYGRAFTHYAKTINSTASLLNGQSIVQTDTLKFFPRSNARIVKNAWFQQLAKQGYRIRIYQSDFVDYCDGDNANIDFCLTYPADSIISLIGSELGLGKKMWLIMLSFLDRSRSLVFSLVRGMPRQPLPGVSGNSAPGRNWVKPSFGSVSSLRLIDRISADLRAAPSGTAFFAHLMIPHFSYVYERDCRVRSNLTTWYNRSPWSLTPTTPELRMQGYSRYFSQIRCMYRKLGELLRGMKKLGILETATVIIQGDHGSRLWLIPSRIQNAARVSDRDIIDGFSTLFAVRTPTLQPGYDRRMRSIQSLFAEIGLGRPIPEDHQDIFLENPDDQKNYLRRPMVRFGDRDTSGAGMGK